MQEDSDALSGRENKLYTLNLGELSIHQHCRKKTRTQCGSRVQRYLLCTFVEATVSSKG